MFKSAWRLDTVDKFAVIVMVKVIESKFLFQGGQVQIAKSLQVWLKYKFVWWQSVHSTYSMQWNSSYSAAVLMYWRSADGKTYIHL